MGLVKILLVMMLACGFVVDATFFGVNIVKPQDGEGWRESNQCGFCYYYFLTGHSPYEVLWKLRSEIRPYLSLKSQDLMLMDLGRLKVADYFFKDYCNKFCGETFKQFGHEIRVADPCQRKYGFISHEF